MFSQIISIVFSIIVYKYLGNLEKIQCTCALTENRKYIMYYLLASIAVNVLYPICVITNSKSLLHTCLYMYTIMAFVSIVFSIYAFQYLYKLREDNCECSESVVRDMYYYYLIVSFFMFCIAIIFGMITYFGFLKDLKKTYSPKKSKKSRR